MAMPVDNDGQPVVTPGVDESTTGIARAYPPVPSHAVMGSESGGDFPEHHINSFLPAAASMRVPMSGDRHPSVTRRVPVAPAPAYDEGADTVFPERYSMFQKDKGAQFDAQAASIRGNSKVLSPVQRQALHQVATDKAKAYMGYTAMPELDHNSYGLPGQPILISDGENHTVAYTKLDKNFGENVPVHVDQNIDLANYDKAEGISRYHTDYANEFQRLNPNYKPEAPEIVRGATAPTYAYDRRGRITGMVQEGSPLTRTKGGVALNAAGEPLPAEEQGYNRMVAAGLTPSQAATATGENARVLGEQNKTVNGYVGNRQTVMQFNPATGRYDIKVMESSPLDLNSTGEGRGANKETTADKIRARGDKAATTAMQKEADNGGDEDAQQAAWDRAQAMFAKQYPEVYGAAAASGTSEQPPVKGAQKSPKDGNWYVFNTKTRTWGIVTKKGK